MSAPKKESAPPTTQARYTSLADPTACIISAGTRKIPLPIMVPTTMAEAWLTPRSRESSGRLVVSCASSGMFEACQYTSEPPKKCRHHLVILRVCDFLNFRRFCCRNCFVCHRFLATSKKSQTLSEASAPEGRSCAVEGSLVAQTVPIETSSAPGCPISRVLCEKWGFWVVPDFQTNLPGGIVNQKAGPSSTSSSPSDLARPGEGSSASLRPSRS